MNELSRPILEDSVNRASSSNLSGRRDVSDHDAILRMVDIHSGYGEVEVLKGVSFEVFEKDLICIIGNNGAGKSTLLKTIFGQVQVSQGSITLRGEDITGESPNVLLRRGVAMTPQGRCNFPEMTVKENLEMGAFTRNDQRVKEDIDLMLEKFPVLSKKRSGLAGNLSGGEQQILEMACALLLHPQIFLIDEPSLGLAPMMTSQVFEAITDINDIGTTIVLVEQNAKQALEISNRAIVLDLGVVRMDGPAIEIRTNSDIKHLFLGE